MEWICFSIREEEPVRYAVTDWLKRGGSRFRDKDGQSVRPETAVSGETCWSRTRRDCIHSGRKGAFSKPESFFSDSCGSAPRLPQGKPGKSGLFLLRPFGLRGYVSLARFCILPASFASRFPGCAGRVQTVQADG